MSTETVKEDPRLISFNTLRKAIGLLGILLPAGLLLENFLFTDCCCIQDSISHYYFTIGGNLFTGTLCAVALFLISYRGYPGDKDYLLTTLAGLFALGVAFFPTNDNSSGSCAIVYLPDNDPRRIIHYTCATLFFLLLAAISFYFFTRSKGEKTGRKKLRNKIYRTCGIVITVCISLIALYGIFGKHLTAFDKYKIIFWLEWVALLAFGASWLIKGELVLKDKPTTATLTLQS